MNKISTVGALILAGGQNRRMAGRHKATLSFQGHTFLEHLTHVFENFDEKLISSNLPELALGTGFTVVADDIPGQGPLGGLAAALNACRSDALIVCACDMPLLSVEFVLYLKQLAFELPAQKLLACQDRSGRIHPLCGVYHKSAYPVIQAALERQEHRVMQAFYALEGMPIPLSQTEFPDAILSNVNTPEEFAQLIAQQNR